MATQIRNSVNFQGGATVSGTRYRFGGTSYLFDGVDSRLSVDNSSDWDLLSGNWTVDFWVRLVTAPGTTATLFVISKSGTHSADTYSVHVEIDSDRHINASVADGSSTYSISGTTALALDAANQWYHVALVRNGTAVTLYVNGASEGTPQTVSSSLYFDLNCVVSIGARYDASLPFSGYLDEIRFSKVARWTSGFSTPTEPSDPDDLTVLLLHADGDIAGKKSISVIGTPIIVKNISPFTSIASSSMKFNGSTDYLSSPNSLDWNLQNYNWTIEFWFNPQSLTGKQTLYSLTKSDGSKYGPIDIYTDGTALKYSLSSNGSSWNISNGVSIGTVSIDNWYHVILMRSGSTIQPYLSGVAGTATTSSALLYFDTETQQFIGCYGNVAFYNGYMTELRISKKSARFPLTGIVSHVVPPNLPYGRYQEGVDGYTKLLLHGNGANNEYLFPDSSYDHLEATKYGIGIRTTVGAYAHWFKFGGSCIEADFGASTANITYPGTSFNFGTQDFTIDMWCYIVGSGLGGIVALASTVNTTSGAPTTGMGFWIKNNTNTLLLYLSSNGSSWDMLNGQTITATVSSWNHIALVRKGTLFFVFLNGAAVYSFISSSAIYWEADQKLWVGNWYTASTRQVWINELRISTNIARWDNTFTPPTRQYDEPPIDEYTKLLIHGTGGNGSRFIVDAGRGGHAITPMNKAQISTAQYKFKGSSVYFYNSGDYLSVADSAHLDFGSGNFTVDWWEYRTSSANNITAIRRDSTVGSAYILGQATDGTLFATFQTDSTAVSMSLGTITLNTWNHMAVTRSGDTFTTYKNGVQVASDTMGGSLTASSAALLIGTHSNLTTTFNGYMQEIRLSVGTVRWTGAFNPPTRAYGNPTWQS